MMFRELPINVSPHSPQPLSLQIVDALIMAMRSGLLPPGSGLPGSRALADQLEVSRGTVVAAFDELRAKGWIEARQGSGSRVSDPLPGGTLKSVPVTNPEPPLRAFDLPTRPDLATDHVTRLFKFSHSVPDARLMSADILGRAYSRAMRRRAHEMLDSGDPLGEIQLRQELITFLRERHGIVVEAQEILITRGSHQGLRLSALGLVKAGDRVAVEDPGSPKTMEVLQRQGAQLVPIPVDEDGLDVDALEAAVKQGGLRLVYVSPRFQMPTTVSLSPERRRRLLVMAQQHRFGIVEDDSEADFTFEGRPLPSLAAEDKAGSVIHLFSLSRILAPGLRIGLIAGPKHAVARLSKARLQTDTLGDTALERAVASMLQDGEIRRHLQRVHRVYRERRDHLLARLTRFFGKALSCTPPSGGLSLWMRTHPNLDLDAWQKACLDRGIDLRLGRDFMIGGTPVPAFPLAFGAFESAEMDQILLQMHQALPTDFRSGFDSCHSTFHD